MGGVTGAKTPSIFYYNKKVYRMVEGSVVSSTVSLMELSICSFMGVAVWIALKQ